MGKSEKTTDTDKESGGDYEQKKKFCAVIAKPLADEKLCKKVYKLAKKASKRKQIRRGVKEVVKALRKNSKGWVSLPPRRPVPGSVQTFVTTAKHALYLTPTTLPLLDAESVF